MNLRKVFYALCLVPYAIVGSASASIPVTGPAPAMVGGGGNLTNFSGNMGAINNNQWNQMMNRAGPGGAAAADFGNCNAVVLRCASPKCASGGCVDMSVAKPIAAGCVASNPPCDQYGDNLVNSIAAQLVANSNAKVVAAQQQTAQQAAAAQAAATAQAAAATAAAQNQNNATVAAMQQQMTAMQQQIAQQNEESNKRMEAALAAQSAQNAAALTAAATTPTPTPAPTPIAAAAQAVAAEPVGAAIARGATAETLARNQAAGKVMTDMESVTDAMKGLKASMDTAFTYANCNPRGEQCKGPKRAEVFKNKVYDFVNSFENVQSALYSALSQAQALGLDMSDIYMMLNDSCNKWGQYICPPKVAMVWAYRDIGDPSGNTECGPNTPTGMCQRTIDPRCQLIRMLTDMEEIKQAWLYPDQGTGIAGDKGANVLLGCASDALDNSVLFKNIRPKIDDINIEDISQVMSMDAVRNRTASTAAGEAIWDMTACAGAGFQDTCKDGLRANCVYKGTKKVDEGTLQRMLVSGTTTESETEANTLRKQLQDEKAKVTILETQKMLEDTSKYTIKGTNQGTSVFNYNIGKSLMSSSGATGTNSIGGYLLPNQAAVTVDLKKSFVTPVQPQAEVHVDQSN